MKKYYTLLSLIVLSFLWVQCANDASETTGNTPSDGKGGSFATFALKNDYLYTVDRNSLHIFWIQNPANPVKVGTVAVGFAIETIYSLDHYLFIGSQNGMYIYDISAPENPKKLSQAQHFTACDPVVANNTHAYVTLHSNSNCGNMINLLQVYDLADITQPVLVHERNLTMPRGLALYDHYLIVCDDELKIFDITHPEEPTIVKSLPYQYKDVVVINQVLYAFGENRITQFKWETGQFLNLQPVSTLTY